MSQADATTTTATPGFLDYLDLAEVGFRLTGVAQTLSLMASSDAVPEGMRLAIDNLGILTREQADLIDRHSDAVLALRKAEQPGGAA